jgi:hypothetical protein
LLPLAGVELDNGKSGKDLGDKESKNAVQPDELHRV